jgi:hypothetical protein
MYDRIQLRIHKVLDFSFLGDCIATSISFCVIDLFRWLISSWFSFEPRNGRKYLDGHKYLEICPFLQDFQIYWTICSQSSLWWFPGFPWCWLLSPLLHFWFYWFGFFLYLFYADLPRVFQSFLFFQRTSFLFHWFFVFFGFYFINFNPYFLLFLSFYFFWVLLLLVFLGIWDVALSHSLICDLSVLLIHVLMAINFPLRSAFAVFHRFW